MEDGDAFLPGLSAHLVAGHTPGCLAFRVTGGEAPPVLFSGDAALLGPGMVPPEPPGAAPPALPVAAALSVP